MAKFQSSFILTQHAGQGRGCRSPCTTSLGAGQAQPYFEFVSDAAWGALTSFRNRRGSVYTLTYTVPSGQTPNLATITAPNSGVLTLGSGIVTFENGDTATWGTDQFGNRSQVTVSRPGGFSIPTTDGWEGDSQHNLLTHTDGASNTWEYTFDNQGNVLTVEDPVTAADPNVVKETHTYGAWSRPTSFTNALGQRTDFYYNSAGDLTRVVDPLNYETVHTYDSTGQRLTTTDPRSAVWQWTYDSHGNVTQTKTPLLHTTTATFSTLGQPLTVTDPTGLARSFTYDTLGRQTRVTHADGNYVETTYDAEGAVTQVRDENGKLTTTTINNMGWVTAVTNSKSETTSFGHNARGHRTSLTNARSKTTTFAVDQNGRLTRTDYPDGTSETVTYNGAGRMVSRTDGRGYTVGYTYDPVGRVTDIAYPIGAGTTISYRNDDRRTMLVDRSGTTQWAYNARGETTQVTQPHGTVSYTYDAAGNRATVSRGSNTQTFTYDASSRLTAQTNGYGETTAYTLDAAGRILQQTQQNGTKVLPTYHAQRGWVTAVEHRKSDNSLLARYEYSRDAAGQITAETQPGDHTVSYTYDNAYQLTREQRTGSSAYDLTYTYDAVGNRLTKSSGGSTDTYTYGDNNQLLTAGGKSYTYDNNGNVTAVTVGGQTTTLTWDCNDKLTQIAYPGGATNTFVTSDLDQRLSKTDSAGTTNTVYDGAAVLADSRADYTRGGLTGLISERTGSTSKYYHADALGSTRGLTDHTQAVTDTRERDAWGLTVSSTGSTATPFGFVGGQDYRTDPDSGLMLLGARYYDPSVGRFLSRDPLRYGGGDVNLYRYCNNNPVNATDPSGCIAPVLIGIGAILLIGVLVLVAVDVYQQYHDIPAFADNVGFLWDVTFGTGDNDRTYPPGDPHSDQLRDSNGGRQVTEELLADRAAGREMRGEIGTFPAFFNSVAEYNATQGQVGGFFWTAEDNGNGTATVSVDNEAGAFSFFFHVVPDHERGPGIERFFGTIHQHFDWIVPYQ